MTPQQIQARARRLRLYRDPKEIASLYVDLPRKLTSLHQIEISSRCNLRCVYCPSPTLARSKVDMTEADFVRALEWVKFYRDKGTQFELNLAGIGESTLHPRFVDFVAFAREAIGETGMLILATNGIGYGEDLVKAVKPFNLRVFVSLHRPEKAGIAAAWWRKHGLLDGLSTDPVTAGNNWAGQVAWEGSEFVSACQWLREGMAMVMADGRITTCCLDASACGVVGTVHDEIDSVAVNRYKLCGTCHHTIGIVGVDR